MKPALILDSGYSSSKEQFQIWKLIEPLEMNLDNDEMNHQISFVKITLSNDEKYPRTVVVPCTDKGKQTLPITLVLMAGHHQPFFMLNAIGYGGDFQTGLILK